MAARPLLDGDERELAYLPPALIGSSQRYATVILPTRQHKSATATAGEAILGLQEVILAAALYWTWT